MQKSSLIAIHFFFKFLSKFRMFPKSETKYRENELFLTLLLLNTTCPVLANSVDPDQLASEEAS